MPRRKFSERFVRFCQEADIHGVKLAHPEENESGIVRRVLWLFILIGAFTFLSYFFYLRVDYFLQYETTTKTTYTTSKSDIPLPSPLILCPPSDVLIASCLKIDDIMKLDAANDGKRLLNLQTSNVIENRNNESFLKPGAQNFFEDLAENSSGIIDSERAKVYITEAGISYIRRNIQDNLHYVERRFKWQPLVNTLAQHDLTVPINAKEPINNSELQQRCGPKPTHFDLSVDCESENDESVDCPFEPFLTRWGPCFQFRINARTRIKRFEMSMQPDWLDDLLVFTNKDQMWSFFVDYGGPSQKKLAVNKNTMLYSMNVRKVTKMEKLGPPYEICGTPKHMRNPIDEKYSGELCVEDCRKHCEAAVAANASRFAGDCAADCIDNNSAFHKHKDGCPDVGCNDIKYQVEVISRTGTGLFFGGGKLPMTITLQFSEFSDVTVYTEVPTYSVEALMAELGGTMGLFVGISLLTVLHCMEFVCTEVILCLGRGRRRPPSARANLVVVDGKQAVQESQGSRPEDQDVDGTGGSDRIESEYRDWVYRRPKYVFSSYERDLLLLYGVWNQILEYYSEDNVDYRYLKYLVSTVYLPTGKGGDNTVDYWAMESKKKKE